MRPRKHIITCYVFAGFLTVNSAEAAVSQATMLFLRISPSPIANGRAAVYLPGLYQDPLIAYYNPAGVGMAAREWRVSSGASYTKWLPQFQISNLWVSGTGGAISVGKAETLKRLGFQSPVYYGLGFHNMFLSLGESQRRGPNNEDLGSFYSWESAFGLTGAAATEYVADVALGFTGKYAYSRISPGGGAGEPATAAASEVMFDAGAILDLPLLRTLRRASLNVPLDFHEVIPEITGGWGYTLSNVGGGVSYTHRAQNDPLPRTATFSLGVTATFDIRNSAVGSWNVITLGWAASTEDQLLWRSPYGQWKYSSNLRGDVRVFNNLVLGHSNPEVIKHRGWELGFAEFLYLRRGSYEDHEGNLFYETEGVGVRFAGLYKLYASHSQPRADFGGFLAHIDFGYDVSWYDAGRNHPIDDTVGHCLTFAYK